MTTWFYSSMTQVILLGFICFCCPGMFNAINGMGAGGKISDSTASKANTALYTCFALFGLISGYLYKLLGARLTLLLGGSTYVLYVGAFLSYNHTEAPTFAIIAGAILGIGAALLWTAQGAIMLSYPLESHKGRYISVFWIIFNLGGVLGGFIPFALNLASADSTSGVNDATYVAFMIIMSVGSLLSLLLAPVQKVVREDGSGVVTEQRHSASKQGEEEEGVLECLKRHKVTLLLLCPLFLSSNWFYSYQFNGVNSALFNLPTRGLNNVFYWGAQMVGAALMGRALDAEGWGTRSRRARITLLLMTLLFTGTWLWGMLLQLGYKRSDPPRMLDFRDAARVAGPMTLYSLYGLLDAMFQTLCYWLMGAISNDPVQLAVFAGVYKSVQSAGAAVSWAIDAAGTEYLWQLLVCWGLMTVAVVPAWFATYRIRDTLLVSLDGAGVGGDEEGKSGVRND